MRVARKANKLLRRLLRVTARQVKRVFRRAEPELHKQERIAGRLLKRAGRRLDRIARKVALWPWARLWKFKRIRPYIKRPAKFAHAHHRIAAGAMTGLFVFSVGLPILQIYLDNLRYNISEQAASILQVPNPNVTKKLQYNPGAQAFVFNAEAKKELEPGKNPAELLKHQVGGGGEDDEQLYSADISADLRKGVTYHENQMGLSFTLTPEFTSMRGKERNGWLVYPLNDVNGQLIYTVQAGGLKEDIVLYEHPGADKMTATYKLDLPDSLEARLLDSGEVGLYSADPALFGNISYGSSDDAAKVEKARNESPKNYLAMTIPAPAVFGAGGKRLSDVQSKFSLAGDTLTVTTTGLDKAEYPLSIDPTILVDSASEFRSGNLESNVDINGDSMHRGGVTGGGIKTNGQKDTTLLDTAVRNHAAVAHNGYMYAIGGTDESGDTVATVQYAAITNSPGNSTHGELGTWNTTSSLSTSGLTDAARTGHSAVVYNEYIYVIGGVNNNPTPAVTNTVLRAAINSNGTLSSWENLTDDALVVSGSNVNRTEHSAVVYNGYMYVLGGAATFSAGSSGPAQNSVYMAAINADGSLGSWQTAGANLHTSLKEFTATVYDSRIYVAGGKNNVGTLQTEVRYRQILSDGSLASGLWAVGTGLETARSNHSMTAANGYLYIHGGDDGSQVMDDLLFMPIYATGRTGAWSEIDTQTAVAFGHVLVHYNGFLYIVGGASSTATPAEATGGDSVYDSGGYTYHEFTSTGSSNFVVSTGGDVEYLIVAGGGGGGYTNSTGLAGGGGGAGGVRTGSSTVTATTYAVTVGTGGAGGTSGSQAGTNGNTSSFNSNSATGGGGGGGISAGTGKNGGSGGGAAGGGSNGGSGEAGQGNSGGHSSISFSVSGSGGGGKSAAGQNSPTTTGGLDGGAGGDGATFWGLFTVGGGGGGGAGKNIDGSLLGSGGTGGTGGGGTGADFAGGEAAATAGAANTGGGGGGGPAGSSLTYPNGAAGGSGIVVIRYPSSNIREGVVMAEIAPAGNLSAGGGSVLPISKVADRGSTNTTTPQTSTGVTMSSGGSISTGNYLIARLVLSANVTTFTVPSDPRGNTWDTTSLGVATNGSTQTRIAYARVTTAYQNNDTITFNYGSTSVGAKGIVIEEWENIHATNPFANSTTRTGSTNAFFQGSPLTRSPTAEGQLVYGALGRNGKSCTYTEDTDTTDGSWTSLTTQATTAGGPGCGGSNNRMLNGAYKVVTGVSTQSWSPAIEDGDFAGVLVVFNPGVGDGFYTEQNTGTTRSRAPTIVHNGWVYAIGGRSTSTTPTTGTSRAQINADGSLGSFGAAGGSLNSPAREFHAATIYNGWVYTAGGDNGSGGKLNNVERSQISSSDGLGAWNANGTLNSSRSGLQMQAYNGYLYVFGGYNGTNRLTTVERIPINSNGSLDTTTGWQQTSAQLPAARNLAAAVIHDGYAYVIGGEESGSGEGLYKNTVYYAAIGSNGDISNWNTATYSLNTARKSHSAFVYNGHIYVTGGESSGNSGLDSVEFAAINANGSIDEWNTAPGIATGRKYHGSFAYLGNFYVYGGENSSGTRLDIAEYATINNGGNGTIASYGSGTITNTRSHHAVAVYGDYIYVMGGSSAAGNADRNDIRIGEFNAYTGGITWSAGSMPGSSALSRFSAVAYDGYLYVIGGQNGSGTAQSAVHFAPINSDGTLGTWDTTTALAQTLHSASAAVYDGRVYVAGGIYNGAASSSVHYASFQGGGGLGSWSTTTAGFSTARSDHQLVINNGYAYVIGGYTGSASLNDVQYAEIGSGGDITTWIYGTYMPEVMRGHAAVVSNGYLYVTGGLRGSSVRSNKVTFVALNANGSLGLWQNTAVFTNARNNHVAAAIGGYLYIIGGETSSGVTTDTVRIGAILAQGRKAVYSKQFDIGTTAVLSNIEVNGFRSDQTEIYVRTAGADYVYGANEKLEDITYASEGTPGLCLVADDAVPYVHVTVVLDDTTQAAFSDIANLESRLTGITIESQPDRAPPDKRLRGGKWFTDSGTRRPFDTCGFAVIGGNNTYDNGGYRYHEFKTTGIQTLKVYKADNLSIDYLIVAGGGGGAYGGEATYAGGGGGAGGVKFNSTTLSDGTYSITVGGGGAGSMGGAASPGQNSTAFGQTASGGGRGGLSFGNGGNGGSGGGGGSTEGTTTSGGNGTSGEGNNGGSGRYGPGGGGGKSAPGQNGSTTVSVITGGNGGAGQAYWSDLYCVGGGGGGGGDSATGGPGIGGKCNGFSDGGGNGGDILTPTPAQAGAPNTGGGGGGGAGVGIASENGGSGGSGIVVVRYQLSVATAPPTEKFARADKSGQITEGNYVSVTLVGYVGDLRRMDIHKLVREYYHHRWS